MQSSSDDTTRARRDLMLRFFTPSDVAMIYPRMKGIPDGAEPREMIGMPVTAMIREILDQEFGPEVR